MSRAGQRAPDSAAAEARPGSSDRRDLRRRHEMRAVRDERPFDVLDNRRIDNNRVLRGTEDAVIERLARDDVADGLRDIGRPFDIGGSVARSDAVGGLAGAVGRADESHPAGRENDGSLSRLHQLLSALERDGGHPVDRAIRCAGPAGGVVHDFSDPGNASDRRRVRTDDDRAARLDGNQDLVNRRGRWVRRRHDGADHAEWLRNLDDLAVVDPPDDAHGLDRFDEFVDPLRREQVLLDLVSDDPVAGLLMRELGERFGLRRGRGAIASTKASICSCDSSERMPAASLARRASVRAS